MESEETGSIKVRISDIQHKWDMDIRAENAQDKISAEVLPTYLGYMVKIKKLKGIVHHKLVEKLDKYCKATYTNYSSYEYNNYFIYLFFTGGLAA